MARKRRSDTNQVIYEIVCKSTGDRYIGMTYSRGRAFLGSAKKRFAAHLSNARCGRETLLYDAIRERGEKMFSVRVLEVVRGKKQAHQRETELIKTLLPELNMESMGRKINSVST